jgi:hypothetical protein
MAGRVSLDDFSELMVSPSEILAYLGVLSLGIGDALVGCTLDIADGRHPSSVDGWGASAGLRATGRLSKGVQHFLRPSSCRRVYFGPLGQCKGST